MLVETAIPKRRSVSLFGLGDGSVMREQGGGRPDGETAVGIFLFMFCFLLLVIVLFSFLFLV